MTDTITEITKMLSGMDGEPKEPKGKNDWAVFLNQKSKWNTAKAQAIKIDAIYQEKREAEIKWISVKDRLPDENVLVFDGKNRYIAFYVKKYSEEFECDEDECDLFDYNEENNIAYWQEGWYSEEAIPQGYYDSYWVKREVTHWMPLPQPPESLNKND